MQPFAVHSTTDTGAGPQTHTGDEFVFVQSGTVEVTVPGDVITLEQGDSRYFAATTPHRIRSISPERARLMVVVGERDEADHSPHDAPR
ncbi:cupin domain-containing protein [Nocardia sp. NPDC127526]|uniref:cupin domain-containing protein n=1 Tax=Nocardia sp. NPDC127526 TaxID=3345393 RepID=UPI0036270743